MDPTDPPPCCTCTCLGCGSSSSKSIELSLKKRRLDELIPIPETDIARVEAENEATALREALASHQNSIQNLYAELEEERNASASAASEAMSMILRLQREKAEAIMESRQFKRFAEEKMAHDQQEIAALEDLLFKRDQAIQSLSCEIQAYKHRLVSYGIVEGLSVEPQTPESAKSQVFDIQTDDYPRLRCIGPDFDYNSEATDIEKYPFGETPREHLQNLEQRIYQLERMPNTTQFNVTEKRVVGQSPRGRRTHLRRQSVDSYGSGSFLIRESSNDSSKGESFPAKLDRAWDHDGVDDMGDRVYTIDAVHGVGDDYVSTPRELGNKMDAGGGGVEEGDVKKLYMRLQALEADRESMRQTIISMGTDKAQIVLLKEIAQQLCKEVAPERRAVKRPPFIRIFSVMSAIKWITSFIFWRKKLGQTKYTFGLSGNNAGLLLILEKSPRLRHRRLLSRNVR